MNQDGWVEIENILSYLANTPMKEVAQAAFESDKMEISIDKSHIRR